MKKFILILVVVFAGFVTMSCKKVETVPEYSSVTFSVSLFGDGVPMTKAVSTSDAFDFIQNCMPTYYDLTLMNLSTGNVYSCKTGENIIIPNGEYSVRTRTDYKFFDALYGTWYSKDIGNGCDNSRYRYFLSVGSHSYLTRGPKVLVNETVTVTENNTFTLTGKILSSAIVYDTSLIEKLEGNMGGDTYEIQCSLTNGEDIGVFFIIKSTYGKITLTVTPKQNIEAEVTKISFDLNDLEDGKFYTLSPNMVSRSNIGGIVSTDEWRVGGNLNSN